MDRRDHSRVMPNTMWKSSPSANTAAAAESDRRDALRELLRIPIFMESATSALVMAWLIATRTTDMISPVIGGEDTNGRMGEHSPDYY